MSNPKQYGVAIKCYACGGSGRLNDNTGSNPLFSQPCFECKGTGITRYTHKDHIPDAGRRLTIKNSGK